MNGKNGTGARSHSEFVSSLSAFAQEHKAKRWEGPFEQFLNEIVVPAPAKIIRSSHQYVWDMLRWTQSHEAQISGDEDASEFRMFSRELFGMGGSLRRIAEYFKAAAAGSEVGRRLLLLLGPPSGGKSTLVILLKRGLEEYSQTDDGALYGLIGLPDSRIASAPDSALLAGGIPRNLWSGSKRGTQPL